MRIGSALLGAAAIAWSTTSANRTLPAPPMPSGTSIS